MEDSRDERRHFEHVLAAFGDRERTLARIGEMERHASRLAARDRELLCLDAKFDALRRAAEQNGQLIDAIIEPHHSLFDDAGPDDGPFALRRHRAPSDARVDQRALARRPAPRRRHAGRGAVGAARRRSVSMCAGEFVNAYARQAGEWDCVVTCFFIDTARDVSEYVRTIYALLKPGGLWLNLGPLLYHYAEMGAAEFSVELSWEEWLRDVTYASNDRSMLRMVYDCVHTVCRKPRLADAAHQ